MFFLCHESLETWTRLSFLIEDIMEKYIFGEIRAVPIKLNSINMDFHQYIHILISLMTMAKFQKIKQSTTTSLLSLQKRMILFIKLFEVICSYLYGKYFVQWFIHHCAWTWTKNPQVQQLYSYNHKHISFLLILK